MITFSVQGDNVIQDTENGFVMQVSAQIHLACQIVKNDTRFVFFITYDYILLSI